MSTLRESLHVQRLIPTLTSALLVGVFEVVIASSFAALIFAGPLSRFVQAGIGLHLVAAVIVMAVIGLGTSQPGVLGSIQDVSAAILALAAAGIAARMAPVDHRTFLTVVLAIGLTSVLAGGVFFLLGRLRLGDLVRFVPYPVVGGFLAGTGWLLFKGGVGIMTGQSLTLATLPDLFGASAPARWLPGLALAAGLLLALRTFPRFYLIPATLLLSAALFYVVVALTGATFGGAEEGGWLLGPFPSGSLWRPWAAEALGQADWGAIASQAGNIATIVVLSLLALLLNASGIELLINQDVDLNRELRVAGVANVASGAAGGVVGFHALSLTALASLSGARSRLVGVVSAGLCGLVLLFGASVVAGLPRFVLGGLILLLALSFLVEWLYDAWSRLARAEYAVVVLILLVIGLAGFLPGVAVGLVVAVILFVVNYSQTDVVRHSLDATSFASNVERTPENRERLRQAGDRILILQLQGFIFFGTAKTLFDRIVDRVRDPDLPSLEFLVLDFRRVTGLDSSAVLSFTKVLKLAEGRAFDLVLTGLEPEMARRLARGGLAEGAHPRLAVMADLDHGMQWCEDRLLERGAATSTVTTADLSTWFGDVVADGRVRRRALKYLTRQKVRKGTVLIRQGESASELFFLESGRLAVRTEGDDHGTVRLRVMGPGAVVGELPVYLETQRTASVVAEVASSVYRLSLDDFRRMEQKDPDLAAALHRLFARLLAQRLVDTQRTMTALMD